MYTVIMDVTPELASEWLKKNYKNRSLSHDRIKQYTLAMISGNWVLTHQGIAFDDAGNLLDGQHRLQAVVKSGVTVKMNVTFDVERIGGIMEIDTGRARTYGNIMKMSDVTDRIYLTLNGVVTMFLRVKGGSRNRISPYAIKSFIDRHYNEMAFIAESYGYTGTSVKSQGRRHAPSVVATAAFSALCWGENRDAIEKFGRVWCSNDPEYGKGYNVRLVFEAKDKIRNAKSNAETLNYIENVIRAFANGLKIVRCYDCYPLDSSWFV